jgi:uncharacterized membrane protein
MPAYTYLFFTIEELYPTIANIGTRLFRSRVLTHGANQWYGILEFLFERCLSFCLPLLGYLYYDNTMSAIVIFSSYFVFNTIYFFLALFGFRYVAINLTAGTDDGIHRSAFPSR